MNIALYTADCDYSDRPRHEWQVRDAILLYYLINIFAYSFNINKGLRLARGLLLEIAKLGLPAGCEFLGTLFPN